MGAWMQKGMLQLKKSSFIFRDKGLYFLPYHSWSTLKTIHEQLWSDQYIIVGIEWWRITLFSSSIGSKIPQYDAFAQQYGDKEFSRCCAELVKVSSNRTDDRDEAEMEPTFIDLMKAAQS